MLRRMITEHRADEWISLPGRLSPDELVSIYQSAWLVTSASLAEGWGLTLTEAAACGTPAVATDIRGHRSSVVDGETGVLAPLERLGDTIADVLLDDVWRASLADQALRRARTLSWDRVATEMLAELHAVVCERPRLNRAGTSLPA
jgi:glycosyltransferase involved in cell wall biosynthesis